MTQQPGFAPHVTTLGQGPRRALALHCSLAHGAAWARLAKPLDQDITMVAPDMPSHGRSCDWDETSDFADTAYQAALDTLDATPMDVIGHSFGAVIALRLAVNHPERLRSLTLIEPVFFAMAQPDAPETVTDFDLGMARVADALAEGDRATAARLFNQRWGDGSKWVAIPEKSRHAMIRAIHMIPATAGFLYRDAAGMLAPGRLDRVAMPTLLIRGGASPGAIAAIADGLVARLPNVRQSVIDGAGHMAPITHPLPVANAIKGLLAP